MNVNLSVGHRVGFNTPNLTISNINAGANDNAVTDDQNDKNIYRKALLSLQGEILNLQRIVDGLYDETESRNIRAKNTLDMSNRMDEVIADAAKGDDKTRKPVPDEVVKYMRDNGILVDGKTIDDYISNHGGSDGLDKGSLQAIKAALDNSASRDTDISTQDQLKIQNEFQKYNAEVTQQTNLLSKFGEILNLIAQKMFQ